MVETLASFTAGLLAWTFLEYAIHGWLSHPAPGRIAALHLVHHRDPHAVFTIGAWLPVALLWGALMLWAGRNTATGALTGMVAGFVVYEATHYRIHFCRPRHALARYLQARHLRHHRDTPDGCLGVTSPVWDLIFGTERTEPRVAPVAPLTGRTNVRLWWRFHYLGRRSIPPAPGEERRGAGSAIT